MARSPAQLTLALSDNTCLATGLTLDSIGTISSEPLLFDEDDDDASVPEVLSKVTFRLAGERELARGWKARAADNLAAMKLAAELEAAGISATPEQQQILSRFVGFGASELASKLFRRAGQDFDASWRDIATEIETVTSRTDLASLARATQYAHYTPEFVVRAIWRFLESVGFAGGNILEPGCGTGLFFALMPEQIAAASRLTGIEMDATTARIARLLYPEAWIRAEDFTKAALPETYDLVIGNPPFSDRTVRGTDRIGRLGLSLHDYFIARAIDRLRPGGIGAFVVSRYTMDKQNPKARAEIAAMADLVGAVRMPEGIDAR
jgi:SAM-dependent methyltransferase